MRLHYCLYLILCLVSISLLSSSGSLLSPAIGAEQPALQSPEVGATAPDFTLPDTQGKSHSLNDYKGKFVVLEWVNFQCPFVKKHYDSGNMQKLQKTYTGKGVVWLSICSSASAPGSFAPSELNAMLKEKGWAGSAYLLDPTGKVGKEYGAKATPGMYVINNKGSLIYAGAIDDKPTTDKADIPGANNYVKAALDEALAGKPIRVSSTKQYGCSVKYVD